MPIFDKPIIIFFLFALPTIIIIHEFGHIFFVKLFGGKVKRFRIGYGKKIFSFKNFQVNRFYFIGAEVEYENINNSNKTLRLFVLLGGILFDISTAIILTYLTNHSIIKENLYIYYLKKYTLYSAIYNSIPFSYKGITTDGKQVLDMLWAKIADKNNKY